MINNTVILIKPALERELYPRSVLFLKIFGITIFFNYILTYDELCEIFKEKEVNFFNTNFFTYILNT